VDNIEAVGEFLEELSRGDPVALIVLAFFLIIIAAFGLIWWHLARKMRREDEADKSKWKR
jgi:hypothetical protein